MCEETAIAIVPFRTPLRTRKCECVGFEFLRYYSATHHGLLSAAESEEKISESQVEIQIDVDYLRSLDPKEWKDQDHYAVLGLKQLR